jgi:hypothetical protein
MRGYLESKGGETQMRKITALFVSIAFSLSVAGLAMAQTKPGEQTGKPAAPGQEQKKEMMEKKDEKKAETAEKKADKMAAQKAECLKKATTDEAKAGCEKKFAKKTDKPAAKKTDKMEKKEDAATKKP